MINSSNISTNYDDKIAAIYGNRENIDTGLLAYRDLPTLLLKSDPTSKALDYGCGTGFSSNILAQAGFQVVGADINPNMLREAKKQHPHIEFIELRTEILPFKENEFDLILGAFVFLEMDSKAAMVKVLGNLRKIIKNNGQLVILTTSEHFPKNNWLTAQNDTERNKNIKCGENYQVKDTSNNMVFSDFFYSDQTYRNALREAGFNVSELYQPLGKISDKISWALEWKLPPYSIYICSPCE